jgi:hypothetical protein
VPLVSLASDVVLGETVGDVTGLGLAVAASTDYYFRYAFHFTTEATTTGARFSVNGPASPTAVRYGGIVPTGTAAFTTSSQTTLDANIATSGTGPGLTAAYGLIEGVLRNGSNAGTLILRGFAENVTPDGVLTILAGSSGLLKPITGSNVTRVTADRTVTGTAFADVTDMTFSVAASTNYFFRFLVHYTTNATTTGARFAVNGPASPTAVRVGGFLPTGGTAANYGSQSAYDTAIFAATTGPGGTSVFGVIEGVLRNGSNAGTLALRAAAEVVSPGAVTVLTNSHGILVAF